MKIINYTTIINSVRYRLEEDVCKHIESGWQPIGNVIQTSSADWVQTMVLYEHDTEPFSCHSTLGPGG